MLVKILITVDLDEQAFASEKGVPVSEVAENVADEFLRMGDALTWRVSDSQVSSGGTATHPDVVQTILARSQSGSGGGIPLTRGEVAMLFLDGYAGDGPDLLDIRSQGYGDDDDWDGLAVEDVLEDEDTAFVWTKWEPMELWVTL